MVKRRNSEGPKCRDCGTTCELVGSFSLCPDTFCDRYAIPVNDQGMTDDEAMSQRFKAVMEEGGTFADGTARNN